MLGLARVVHVVVIRGGKDGDRAVGVIFQQFLLTFSRLLEFLV